jgi:hypothetical protein
MPHPQSDAHLRPAIAVPRDSDGYVAFLLGLARDQIMARQLPLDCRPSQGPSHPGPHQGPGARRSGLH